MLKRGEASMACALWMIILAFCAIIAGLPARADTPLCIVPTETSLTPPTVESGERITMGGTWQLLRSRSCSPSPGLAGVSEGSSVSVVGVPHPLYGWHGEGWVYVAEHIGEVIPECVVGVLYVCPGPEDRAVASVLSPESDIEVLAHRVVVTLQLGRPEIRLGPDPGANEWNMAVVGLPVWLWTTEPSSRAATVTYAGQSFSLIARRSSVVFDMGDGSVPFTCVEMMPWPGAPALDVASPVCGHTYSRASLPAGSYALRATGVWQVDWAAEGRSGRVEVRLTSSRAIRVGELQSIRVR